MYKDKRATISMLLSNSLHRLQVHSLFKSTEQPTENRLAQSKEKAWPLGHKDMAICLLGQMHLQASRNRHKEISRDELREHGDRPPRAPKHKRNLRWTEQPLGKPNPKHKAFEEERGAWCTEGQCLRSCSAKLPSPPHTEQKAATGRHAPIPAEKKFTSFSF